MNIFFDIDRFKAWDTYSIEEKTALESIWTFVDNKLFHLEAEIEAEENEGEKKAIIIYLMETPKKIQPRGYSDELHEKIINSFTPKDVELLWQATNDALLRLMN